MKTSEHGSNTSAGLGSDAAAHDRGGRGATAARAETKGLGATAIDGSGGACTRPAGSLAEIERLHLEAQFGDGLAGSLSTAVSALRTVVLRLLASGATRRELLQIGQARGYRPAYVRTILSQILPSAAGRKRKPGAGPKTPKLACVILAFARALVGQYARKYLLAAAHLAKIEDQRLAGAPQTPPSNNSCPSLNDFLSDQIGTMNPLPLIYKS